MDYPAFDNIIGTNIIYNDYLGLQRYGKIAWIEPYEAPDAVDEDGETVWVYIVDDDPQYNVHEFVVNMGSVEKPDIRQFMYADVRLSTEVSIDK